MEFLKLQYRHLRAERSRVVRVGLGLALVMTAGAVYGPELLYTTSSDAIINARAVTLTAPIEGTITAGPPREGRTVSSGEPLLTIVNPTVDHSRLDVLNAEQGRINVKLNSTENLVATLQAQLTNMRSQAEGYRKATVNRLQIMLKESKAAADSARAEAVAADLDYQRVHEIEQTGAISVSDIDQSRQRYAQTKAEMEKATAAAARTALELQSAREGIYVYQDRNNVTYSEQHAEEISVRLAELDAQRAELEGQNADLRRQIEFETTRINRLSRAEIASPLDGIIWRPLVVPGMHVPRDSELLTVIDCSELYVTAALANRKFESIHPGDQARIKIEGSTKTLAGVVVDVRAVESVESNKPFAVPLPATADHRIIAVLKISDTSKLDDRHDYCGIGRKADVRFTGGAAMNSLVQDHASAHRATLTSAQ